MQINGKAAAAAFVKARAAIGATVTRDAKANYGRYATLAAVMEAITPALSANGLALVQEAQLMQDSVEMDAILVHESGETIEFVTLSMPLGTQRTPQAVGSAMTYGRRYQLTALFGLAPDDDDDGQAASKTLQETQNGRATSQRTAMPANARPSVSTTPTAHVDDAAPVDENGPDNPFDAPLPEPERASDKTLKRLHAEGSDFYGEEWDGKRHEIVGAVTKGRTHSSGQISETEAKKLIDGIANARRLRAQAQARAAIESQPDYPARQRQPETEVA